jgi:hypothetical protein
MTPPRVTFHRRARVRRGRLLPRMSYEIRRAGQPIGTISPEGSAAYKVTIGERSAIRGYFEDAKNLARALADEEIGK